MNVTDVNRIMQPYCNPTNDDVEKRVISQQFNTEDVVLNLIFPSQL